MTSDLNDRIAKAKGWRRESYDDERIKDAQGEFLYFYWVSSTGIMQADLPDFVGTLEGVARMLRELGDEWSWKRDGINSMWCCYREYNPMYPTQIFRSPDDRPGDCVGTAYLSMKEADGDS